VGTAVLTAEQVAAAGLHDWRQALRAIHAHFGFASFPAAFAFAQHVADAAEAAQHHPDIDIRYPGTVHVAITTHDVGGVTTADVSLATTISQIARQFEASSEPLRTQALEIALDVTDADAVRPFWAAVLDYAVAIDGSLFDPRGLGPPMWFQHMDPPRRERGRFHLDVTVSHDSADSRLGAAINAGGVLVSAARARAFWVLADAEGNEACICTWQDRT
jgi:4a-hydroxytetrahydrobiopterin dehydratase